MTHIDKAAVLAILAPAPNSKGGLWAKRKQALYDAIISLPAVSPQVKALVWKEYADERAVRAVGFNADYTIRISMLGQVAWQSRHMAPWHPADTVEAAKAAAQADYEARILAALAPAPSDDAVKAREAALKEAAAVCAEMAEQVSDAALTGLPEQARAREAMEAALTQARYRILALLTKEAQR